MPTEIDGETRNEWIDQKATIVKVEASRYFIHIEADLADGKVAWYEAARVRWALRTPLRAEYGPWGSWSVGLAVFGQPARRGT
jgi:hypothetical protein